MAKGATTAKDAGAAPASDQTNVSDQTEAQTGDKTGTDVAETKAGSVQTEGIRARRAFMLKQLLPSADWINVNVVANGKGTQALVGRVYGVCMKTEDKLNTLPDGSPSKSIVCIGTFNSESYVTGEIAESSNAYLPMAYAEKIDALFKANENIRVIEVDVDIGLEATGKPIPYEWVVIAYREGEEMAVLRKLKSSRPRPGNLLTSPGKPDIKLLPKGTE